MKKKINIVWLKRDLRTQDHLPLYLAEQEKIPYLPIFIFEPSSIHHPDCSLRHLQFQYFSLKNMETKIGQQIPLFYEEVLKVFDYLSNTFDIQQMFTYQESGIQLTFDRDKKLKQFCLEKHIIWTEYQRDGIQRGLKQRKNWSQKWEETMRATIVKNSYNRKEDISFQNPYPIPKRLLSKLENYPKSFQPAGEDFAHKYLQSFLKDRIKKYNYHIGKPYESRKSCSRLSPYISWGNLSIRQVYQLTKNAKFSQSERFHQTNFLSRLRWHCHFIQKFEMEYRYETSFLNPAYKDFEYSTDKKLLKAWESGTTGIPIIDANIRCLKDTGWINFRSRALLVSFLSHHLLIDWRKGSYFLAKNFLDYEPGIHYPQMQMQAGTTGINTLRIYNPIKQSKEKDPKGLFIKEWIPELRMIPEEYIHEPHQMSALELQMLGISTLNYPNPIVDVEQSGKIAREKLWSFKRSQQVKEHKQSILEKHVEHP